MHCINQIGSCCKLRAIIRESQHLTLHFHRVLDQFAASTVWRYLSMWKQFSDALRDMDLHLDRITEVELADVFVSLSLSHRSDPSTGAGSISAIKAVRWMTNRHTVLAGYRLWIHYFIISSQQNSKRKEGSSPTEDHQRLMLAKLRPLANHSVSWGAACLVVVSTAGALSGFGYGGIP